MVVSLACSAEIACSGLFLSNRDSVTVGAHSFFGGVDYWRTGVRWRDGWDFDIKWSSANFVAGFHSEFDHVFLGASFQGLSLSSGRALWTPEGGEASGLPTIDAKWETSLLLKNAWAGAVIGEHRLGAFMGHVGSRPNDLGDSYFVMDSANVWFFGGRYTFGAAGATLGYTYVNADLVMQGIRAQDDTRKRFMYAPMSAYVHVVNMNLDLGNVDVRALAGHMDGRLRNDGRRFYETLAANRVLQSSVVQVLSFSFFQKNYRDNADFDAAAIMLGGEFRKRLGAWFEPSVAVDYFYLDAALDGRQVEETTKLFGSASDASTFGWKADCMGVLLGLGVSFRYGAFGVSLNAKQILPLYVDLQRDEVAAVPVLSSGNFGADPTDAPVVADDSSPLDQLGNGLFVSLSFTVSL